MLKVPAECRRRVTAGSLWVDYPGSGRIVRVCGVVFSMVTAAPVSVADKGFDVEFLEPGGVLRRADLSTCWGVRFEDVPPVRSFPSLRGQAHFPGLR